MANLSGTTNFWQPSNSYNSLTSAFGQPQSSNSNYFQFKGNTAATSPTGTGLNLQPNTFNFSNLTTTPTSTNATPSTQQQPISLFSPQPLVAQPQQQQIPPTTSLFYQPQAKQATPSPSIVPQPQQQQATLTPSIFPQLQQQQTTPTTPSIIPQPQWQTTPTTTIFSQPQQQQTISTPSSPPIKTVFSQPQQQQTIPTPSSPPIKTVFSQPQQQQTPSWTFTQPQQRQTPSTPSIFPQIQQQQQFSQAIQPFQFNQVQNGLPQVPLNPIAILLQAILDLHQTLRQVQQSLPTPNNLQQGLLNTYASPSVPVNQPYIPAQLPNDNSMHAPLPAGRLKHESSFAVEDMKRFLKEVNKPLHRKSSYCLNSDMDSWSLDGMRLRNNYIHYPPSPSICESLKDIPLSRRNASTCLSHCQQCYGQRYLPYRRPYHPLMEPCPYCYSTDNEPLVKLWSRDDMVRMNDWDRRNPCKCVSQESSPYRHWMRDQKFWTVDEIPPSLEYDESSKPKKLNMKLAENMARKRKSSPKPRSHFDDDEPVPFFFDRCNRELETVSKSTGPPVKASRNFNLEEKFVPGSFLTPNDMDTLARMLRNPETVANLPKKIQPIRTNPWYPPVPKSTPTPPPRQPQPILRPSTGSKQNEERTSPLFKKKQVRFAPDVQTHILERAKVDTLSADETKLRRQQSSVDLLSTADKKDDSVRPSPKMQFLRGVSKISQIFREPVEPESMDRGKVRCGVKHGSVELEEEEENCKDSSMHRSKVGVKLTRPGYYCYPGLWRLDNIWHSEDGNCFVEDFEVGHMDYGNVVFDGITNVAGINLDAIVNFGHKSIELYPDNSTKPPYNTELNKPCTVTLYNVWPVDNTDKTKLKVITDANKISEMNYEGKLRQACERFGGTFLRYDPNNGKWVFRVQETP